MIQKSIFYLFLIFFLGTLSLVFYLSFHMEKVEVCSKAYFSCLSERKKSSSLSTTDKLKQAVSCSLADLKCVGKNVFK